MSVIVGPYGESLFSYMRNYHGIVSVTDFGHSNSCAAASHFVLIYISLIAYDMGHFFIHLFAICIFFGDLSVKIICLFFNQIICFLIIEL